MEDISQNSIPSIEVKGLCKNYGPVAALRDVSFSVCKGEVVGFLGPNGAGKTTMLRILCGLMPANAGMASVCGVSLARDPLGARRHIGYMPENNPLPEDLRVVEYLRLRASLKNMSGRTLRRRVEEVMELCDLRRKARRKLIGSLSKGYRQRVGIADAILAKPDVAILDEPTIGLDPHQVLTIRKLLGELRGQMTIVISSHILPEIELSCDRVIIMNNGRVVAIGTPGELRDEFVREHCFVVEASGDVDGLKAELARRREDLTISEEPRLPQPETPELRCFEARTKSADDISDLLLSTACALPSVKIRSFYRRKPTLEDVFIAATVRNWETTTDNHETATR
ncbi:MAG: ABC transporter ATP-binding protein [Opitutales bacterium]